MATDRLITISITPIYIGTTTNVGNAYTAGTPPVGGYVVNNIYNATFNVANTSASTLDGHVMHKNGIALVGGEIFANADMLLRWDGTQFNFAGDGGTTIAQVRAITALRAF